MLQAQKLAPGKTQAEDLVKRGRDGRFLTSGNPSGDNINRRYRELYAELSAELGGDLTAIEKALLSQVVTLMCRSRRARSDADAVRIANAATRLLTQLQRKRQHREPRGPTLGDVLRADIEARA